MRKLDSTIPSIAFFAGLFLLGAYILFGSHLWHRAMRTMDSSIRAQDVTLTPAARETFFLENDSYFWASFALKMSQEAAWRIRHTESDNAPWGREVHWSQAVSWLMLAAGKFVSILSERSWEDSLEHGALWINPALQILWIFGTALIIRHWIGILPALVFATLTATLGEMSWIFNPLRPDHQTLHLIFGFSSLLLVVAGGLGWTKSSDSEGSSDSKGWLIPIGAITQQKARAFFAGAGIATGFGFWISATVQSFAVAILIGSLLAVILLSPRENSEGQKRYAPALWRLWGVSAAITSFTFYLLEYAPGDFSMRLEVNHSVYSLALWGCGEFLYRVTRCRVCGDKAVWMSPGMAAAIFAMLLPLSLILFGPTSWHALRDPYMARLHDSIAEFRGYFPDGDILGKLIQTGGILPLFFALSFVLAGWCRLTLLEWWTLLIATFATFSYLALIFLQARWIGFYSASSILLACLTMVISHRLITDSRVRKAAICTVAGALFIQSLFWGARQIEFIWAVDPSRPIFAVLLKPAVAKKFALEVRQILGTEKPIAISDPDLTPALQYFAAVPSLASYYWENRAGLADTVDFLTDDSRDFQKARQIANTRDITSIFLIEGVAFERALNNIRQQTASPDSPTLIRTLRDPQKRPDWVEPDPKLTEAAHRRYRFNDISFDLTFSVFRITQIRDR